MSTLIVCKVKSDPPNKEMCLSVPNDTTFRTLIEQVVKTCGQVHGGTSDKPFTGYIKLNFWETSVVRLIVPSAPTDLLDYQLNQLGPLLPSPTITLRRQTMVQDVIKPVTAVVPVTLNFPPIGSMAAAAVTRQPILNPVSNPVLQKVPPIDNSFVLQPTRQPISLSPMPQNSMPQTFVPSNIQSSTPPTSPVTPAGRTLPTPIVASLPPVNLPEKFPSTNSGNNVPGSSMTQAPVTSNHRLSSSSSSPIPSPSSNGPTILPGFSPISQVPNQTTSTMPLSPLKPMATPGQTVGVASPLKPGQPFRAINPIPLPLSDSPVKPVTLAPFSPPGSPIKPLTLLPLSPLPGTTKK